MSERWVLITGAGSGIGAALARHLAGSGWRIGVSDLDKAAAEQIAGEIAAAGGQARALELDVARHSSIEAAMKKLDAPIDVLINNAGLQRVARLEELQPEQWSQLVGVMLTGAAMMTRAVLPGMRSAGFGRIVNIGSIHGLVASPFKSAYVAAKHGLIGFSKVIALETASADITINTICPAYVLTPLVSAQIAAQAREHGLSEAQVAQEIMLKPMPKRRFVTVEEIAGSVDFLLSPAARNITGQCIVIDGGWTAQ